jgi:hypothetical protein
LFTLTSGVVRYVHRAVPLTLDNANYKLHATPVAKAKHATHRDLQPRSCTCPSSDKQRLDCRSLLLLPPPPLLRLVVLLDLLLPPRPNQTRLPFHRSIQTTQTPTSGDLVTERSSTNCIQQQPS